MLNQRLAIVVEKQAMEGKQGRTVQFSSFLIHTHTPSHPDSSSCYCYTLSPLPLDPKINHGLTAQQGCTQEFY